MATTPPQPRRPMTAEDFASTTVSRHYPFGVDEARAIAALRALADRIEAKLVIVERATVVTTAQHDEFAVETLILRLHEKRIGGD